MARTADETGRWVGQIEIAEMLGVPSSTVRTMRSRDQLPPPTFTIAAGPVWRKNVIERWLARR